MPRLDIYPVAVEQLRAVARRAARDHVSISETRSTTWFAHLRFDVIVATGAVMHVGSGVRLKGAWVDPAWRGQGIGLAMVDFRIAKAEEACASFIETLSLHPEFFERRGFHRHGAILPSGAVKLRRFL